MCGESRTHGVERGKRRKAALTRRSGLTYRYYPIFIAYQKNSTDQYHQSIKKCIEHIASEYTRLNIIVPASFDYRLFFIFLPLSEVKQIKENVIKWIDSREPLI